MNFEKTKKLLIEDEGLERFAYKCTSGKVTIGVGRNIDKNGGRGLSLDEVDYLLKNDLKEALNFLSKFRFWGIANDDRRAALISMYHNLGATGFTKFKNTIALLDAGDWLGASKAILKSKWATQVPNRVKKMAKILEQGKL